MHILILATGGTIGSAVADSIIAPNSGQELLLLEKYRARYQTAARFTVQEICTVLSENADDRFYETLIHALKTADRGKYNGIIVLHGTDTLSYTAALCAMACCEIPIPVCFVSSAYVLTDPRQNGLQNFHAAVRYIESGLHGFTVPYRNRSGETQIHLATRICEADFFTDDFHSAADLPLAFLEEHTIRLNASPALPTQAALSAPMPARFQNLHFQKSVLPLKLMPNLDLDAVAPSPSTCAAVLCIGYHSGTAPQVPLLRFANRLQLCGIPVYLAPVKRQDTQYKSTDDLLQAQMHPLFNMTPESALAKLKLAYHQTALPPEDFLAQTVYFETV